MKRTIKFPCTFTASVSDGRKSIGLGVTVSRDSVDLVEFDEVITDGQLDVTLTGSEEDEAQGKLDGIGDDAPKLSAVATVHGIAVRRDEISFRLSFNDSDLDYPMLRRFKGIGGKIVAKRTGDASVEAEAPDPAQSTIAEHGAAPEADPEPVGILRPLRNFVSDPVVLAMQQGRQFGCKAGEPPTVGDMMRLVEKDGDKKLEKRFLGAGVSSAQADQAIRKVKAYAAEFA